MSVGSKITNGLERTRLSLAGAMIGSLGSNVFGSTTSSGPSLKRDFICAGIGFALCLWMLISEAKREAQRKSELSVKLDTSATAIEKH